MNEHSVIHAPARSLVGAETVLTLGDNYGLCVTVATVYYLDSRGEVAPIVFGGTHADVDTRDAESASRAWIEDAHRRNWTIVARVIGEESLAYGTTIGLPRR